MTKTALITGITGQDGAYLADFLLKMGYCVSGAYRRTSVINLDRLEYLGVKNLINLLPMDLTDQGNIVRVLQEVRPDEIYNLAAQSFVGASFEQPVTTGEITGLGVTNILEAIRLVNKDIKYYQASTSEMFGKVQAVPQNEKTPFYPRSPYGAAKLYAHWMTVNYREAYGMYTCSGILFNHESPLRGLEFVTRKITSAVARIKYGLDRELRLGNLEAKRDWGYAMEYVEAMWLMLQQDQPDEYVIATGEAHSVREFVQEAFGYADLDWEQYVVVDPSFYRPAEVELLVGDPAKAREKLGWRHGTTFKQLVQMMVKADLERVGQL